MKEQSEMTNTKVSPDVAIIDFERWLSIKKIKEQKRNENSKSKFEDIIISAIVEGDLTIDDAGYITHKLSFPIKNDEGEETLTQLRFMPRIPVKLLNIKLKGVDPSDGDKRQLAYMSALTNVNMGLLGNLDSEDHRVCQAIVMYFL